MQVINCLKTSLVSIIIRFIVLKLFIVKQQHIMRTSENWKPSEISRCFVTFSYHSYQSRCDMIIQRFEVSASIRFWVLTAKDGLGAEENLHRKIIIEPPYHKFTYETSTHGNTYHKDKLGVHFSRFSDGQNTFTFCIKTFPHIFTECSIR